MIAILFAGCASRGPLEPVVDEAPPEPIDVSTIPNAVPKPEPLSRYGNPVSYVVAGKRYYTMPSSRGYSKRGIASWYGTKFHGQRTSSGEPYDLYAMTAAHRTLPLPTYVEVTNLRNNKSVIVKVNDRGPFHKDRLIDLSYAAAAKLGILGYGTGLVQVRAIDTGSMAGDTDGSSTGKWQTLPPKPARPMTVAQQAAASGAETAPVTKPEAVPVKAAAAPVHSPLQQPAVATPARAQPVAAADNVTLFLQVGAFMVQENALRLQARIREQVTREVRIVASPGSKGTFYKVQVGPLSSPGEADRIARALKPLGINESRAIIQ